MSKFLLSNNQFFGECKFRENIGILGFLGPAYPGGCELKKEQLLLCEKTMFICEETRRKVTKRVSGCLAKLLVFSREENNIQFLLKKSP